MSTLSPFESLYAVEQGRTVSLPPELEALYGRFQFPLRPKRPYVIADSKPVYSIDTPPPTISGNLHLGHMYSYTHPDIFARFQRMRGNAVYYPMGFDNNGLPTERLVEKRLGLPAASIGRIAFIKECLRTSQEAEAEYTAIFTRLGLSVDWRWTYRTIHENARRISQYSFIELYRRGLAYRQEAPTIWCPECRTALAQADLNDLERQSEFVTIGFHQEDGTVVPIATTRPEYFPACVAIGINPTDKRYTHLIGKQAMTPLFGKQIPIIANDNVPPPRLHAGSRGASRGALDGGLPRR